MFLSRGRAK